jgi:hypothetical protein
MMKLRIVAQAAILATSTLVAPWVGACPAPSAKPFTAGPLMVQPAAGTKWAGPFSEWIVDSNGISLQICTDAVDAAGNPPPCFFDPVDPANAYTQQLTRGGEAFYYLANSAFTTVGAAPVDAVIVMGVESAFLSDPPAAGFETQFQRLRTRLNVSAVGIYTVETPWGKTNYRVDTLLPPGSGQNRSEISEPIDISFSASASNAGLVTPFLIATNKGGMNPSVYLGDGVTPSTVTGSPCGTNFVRVTAVGLDGVTPININNGSNVYTDPLFTVMGKYAPAGAVPLSISAAYYTVSAGATNLSVMAETSRTSTGTVDVGGVVTPLTHDANRFYASVPVVGALPATVSVTASDSTRPSTPNTLTASVTDLITVALAEARCSGTGITKSCLLTVNATSSDDGSAGVVPVLTLAHNNTALINGTVAVTSQAVPAAVTVTSSQGGVAVKPVTIINQ